MAKRSEHKKDTLGFEFDLWFPVLAKALNSLPAMTNFEAVRRSLKYASEDFYN